MGVRDIPIRVIREQLQLRVNELVPMLVPGGRREGSVWSAPNPTRAGDGRGSFKVWLTGNSPGCFKEYDAGDTERGDIIDLIAYAHFGDKSKRGDAIRWAKDFLGLDQLSTEQRERLKREANYRREKAAQREAERDQHRRRRAFDMFISAQKSLRDTLAEQYLLTRGIELDALPAFEHGEIRFAPEVEWWKGAQWREVGSGGRRERVRPGPAFPALVSALRNWRGEITGVHCTFLAKDGSGKADVDPPKLVFGTVSECVVRLTRGPSNLTPEEWRKADPRPPGDPLVISEGIETGLSIAMAAPEARVWAAYSLSNIGNVYVDHPCISSVIVAAENDVKPAAVAAFERAMARLEEHGKPVTDMRSHVGSDFNDLLKG